MTNRSIARGCGVAESTVRHRLAMLSRQAQLYGIEKENNHKISEPLSYDGFETFTGSQYSPCYVNTMVGKDSLFQYAANFSYLNRKGRMTPQQLVRNHRMNLIHGRYPSDSIREQSLKLFESIALNLDKIPTILHTDEHSAYRLALRKLPPVFSHQLTNSQEIRNAKNPLFPVNHLHLLYRHFLAGQRRETIAFQKNEAGLMDKIQLMRLRKNYMQNCLYKKSKAGPWKNRSPAMVAGIAKRILLFEEIFKQRRFSTHHIFNLDELAMFQRKYPYSRQAIRQYYGI